MKILQSINLIFFVNFIFKARVFINLMNLIFRFKSEKTGRGPLVGADWKKKVDPVMTCYKLVTCEFKWFGLQSRIENFIQKSERRLFTNFHR